MHAYITSNKMIENRKSSKENSRHCLNLKYYAIG